MQVAGSRAFEAGQGGWHLVRRICAHDLDRVGVERARPAKTGVVVEQNVGLGGRIRVHHCRWNTTKVVPWLRGVGGGCGGVVWRDGRARYDDAGHT